MQRHTLAEGVGQPSAAVRQQFLGQTLGVDLEAGDAQLMRGAHQQPDVALGDGLTQCLAREGQAQRLGGEGRGGVSVSMAHMVRAPTRSGNE